LKLISNIIVTKNLCNINIAKPNTTKMAEWINAYL